jgi:hypothetical protein
MTTGAPTASSVAAIHPTAMKKRRRLGIAITNALIIAPAAICHAQAETDSARAVRHAAAAASLAKASQNPVANMVSLPLQYNFITAGGPG